MAISFDTSNSGTTAGSSLTISHTMSSSGMLVVGINLENTTSDIVTGVTYNGVSMTQAVTKSEGVDGRTYIYYLNVGDATSANVVISRSSTPGTMYGITASYLEGGKLDATNTANGNDSSPAGSVTSSANNCWGVLMIGCNGGISVNSSLTGGVMRVNASGMGLGDNNSAKTPAGSISFTGSLASTARWTICFITIKPAITSTNLDNVTITDSQSGLIASTYSDTVTATGSISSPDWQTKAKTTPATWTTTPKS